MEWRLSHVPNLYSQKQQLLEQLAPKMEVLILGGCEAQSAFKPSEWDRVGLNFATANQSAVVAAQIFTKALPKLPALRTLVMPASYLSWQGTYELQKESWRNYFYTQFFHVRGELSVFRFLDVRTFSLFFLYWPFSRQLLWSTDLSQHHTYRPLHGERMPFLPELPADGFLPFDTLDDVVFEPVRVNQGIQLWHRSLQPERLQTNRKALQKIVQLARDRGVRVLFVKTPVAAEFRKRMLPSGIALEDEALAILSKEENVAVVDFRSKAAEHLFDRNDFADAVHLSESGAIKLSRLTRQYL